MHPWILQEFGRLHNAELAREADHVRLASLARAGREDVKRTAGRSESSHDLAHLAHLADQFFRGRTPHPKGH